MHVPQVVVPVMPLQSGHAQPCSAGTVYTGHARSPCLHKGHDWPESGHGCMLCKNRHVSLPRSLQDTQILHAIVLLCRMTCSWCVEACAAWNLRWWRLTPPPTALWPPTQRSSARASPSGAPSDQAFVTCHKTRQQQQLVSKLRSAYACPAYRADAASLAACDGRAGVVSRHAARLPSVQQ